MLPFLLPPVPDLQFRIFSSPISQEGANCIISTTRVPPVALPRTGATASVEEKHD